MDKNNRKAAVFILFGQSNAAGHDTPMCEEDIIREPMKNVFGLSRTLNQSFDNERLFWSGYTSFGMNLGEELDNTYSLANQLARVWQDYVDKGNSADIPDLYIIQIAVGAQGVTENYMWYPKAARRLHPGVFGVVDISLYPFSCRILSLLKKSFDADGIDYDIIGLHWRGGENDTSVVREDLDAHLNEIYSEMLSGYNRILNFPKIYMHRIIAKDRMFDLDPSGKKYERMCKINAVFESLCEKFPNVEMFDASTSPLFLPDVCGNGVFISDHVHYTPELNMWAAECILNNFVKNIS